MSAATATSKGQITIPKDVRDELGIEPGTKVDFVRTVDGRYWLRPRTKSISALFGSARYHGPPVSIEEMNEGIRDAWAGTDRQ